MNESGTGTALAAVIPKGKLVRVLVVDDAVDFPQDMIDYFDIYGYSVDVARDIEEARVKLEKNEYQIVLVDVNFEGELKGDSFVLQNQSIFKGARVVVVTALNVNELRHRIALEEINIPIWGKEDDNWGSNLTGLTKETAKAREQEIADQLNDFISDKLGDPDNYVVTESSAATAAAATDSVQPAPEPWEIAVEDILIEWLNGQNNPERPFYSVGRAVFSPIKMIEQIQQKTEIGKELLEMFATEIKYSLGLGSKPTFRS